MSIQTIENPKAVQIEFYSGLYKREKSDSPNHSRASLLKRVTPFFPNLEQRDFVLELGSGRQIATREYLRDRCAQPFFTIVTLDIAEITSKQLLVKRDVVTHTRADGEHLPFREKSFHGVFSNMALDFMGEGAISEIYRILKFGGFAEINLHHPDMFPDNLEDLLTRRKISKSERTVLEYWTYLKRNNILTTTSDELKRRFIREGFIVKKVDEACDSIDKWWEVSIRKPTEAELNRRAQRIPDVICGIIRDLTKEEGELDSLPSVIDLRAMRNALERYYSGSKNLDTEVTDSVHIDYARTAAKWLFENLS